MVGPGNHELEAVIDGSVVKLATTMPSQTAQSTTTALPSQIAQSSTTALPSQTIQSLLEGSVASSSSRVVGGVGGGGGRGGGVVGDGGVGVVAAGAGDPVVHTFTAFESR